jgi:hypothetical protein
MNSTNPKHYSHVEHVGTVVVVFFLKPKTQNPGPKTYFSHVEHVGIVVFFIPGPRTQYLVPPNALTLLRIYALTKLYLNPK